MRRSASYQAYKTGLMVNPTNRAPDEHRANDARTHRKVAEAFTRSRSFAQRPISSSSDARISGS